MSTQIKKLILLIIISFQLTTLLVYPFFFKLKTNYPNNKDFLLNAWTYWYSFKSVTSGRFFNPKLFFTPPQLYPFPDTLAQIDPMVLPSTILYGPAYIISKNHVLSVNITIFCLYMLNFISAFLVLSKFFKNTFAVLTGAVVFTFSSGVINLTGGHTEYLGRFLIPPFFYFLLKFLQNPKFKNSFILFSVYFLSWFTNIQITIFLSLLSPIVYVVWVITYYRNNRYIPKILPLLTNILICVLIFAPILFYFFSPYIEYSIKESFNRSIKDAQFYSANISDFFIPTPDNMIFGKMAKTLELVRPSEEKSFNYAEHTLFTGYLSLTFLLIFLFQEIVIKKIFKSQPDRNQIFWLICFVCLVTSITISLGPFLRIGTTDIKLPYYYLYYLVPLFQAIRTPTRIQYIWVFFIAYIISYGLNNLFERQKQKSNYIFQITIFIVLLIFNLTKFQPNTYITRPINFDLGNKIVLFLPERLDLEVDNAGYLIQHVSNNFISVNGSTGSQREIDGYGNLNEILKKYAFSEYWFNILHILDVSYVAIDKPRMKNPAFVKDNIAKGLSEYKRLVVYEDNNWAILDLSKLDNPIGVKCPDLPPIDLNLDFKAFYSNVDNSLFVKYTLKNHLNCDMTFLNEKRYIKINYSIENNNDYQTFYITMPPFLLLGNSYTGRVKVTNIPKLKPESIYIRINGNPDNIKRGVISVDYPYDDD